MYFEQFYLGCLAHASYMLGSGGEALVVDPQRDVDLYLKAADEHGLKISHIFETHLHADFVSGHKELAARTGARIYIGEKAGATYPHVDAHDGYELQVGQCRISVLETPGHTPESVCLVVTDLEKSQKPWAVLTGDTLFIGDVGRPDLSESHTPEELAGLLYDSLHKKLMKLPNEVLVYPAHGAGSLCGRNMRAERSSTIGTERLTNYALQIRSRSEFVHQLTSNLPARPDYFQQDAEINREGAASLDELPELPLIPAAKLSAMMDDGTPALDVRPPEEFAAGHVPGSINIGLSGQFASWAGALLGLESRPVLIADSQARIDEARMRLARVGIEELSGYLESGVSGWTQAGFSLAHLPQITAQDLNQRRRDPGLHVLDVRRAGEWEAGHVAEAHLWPLDRFKEALPLVDKTMPMAVHCKSGYRSTIACSLLMRAGYRNVINVVGGFDAWQTAQLLVTKDATIAV
ncbi:MAG TPA: rhodanese-like domain-containing protein [Terriglobales bacterium]|nr:rhodanese-like domain-containing protein [Terriglobales bacterium]